MADDAALDLFGDDVYPVPCPKCHQETPQELRRLYHEHEFTCPACGTVTPIDSTHLRQLFAAVRPEAADLRKALHEFLQQFE